MDMQYFASYSTMPGPIPGACLKFVMCTDQSLCLLKLWHFFLICFTYTCNWGVTCYYECSLQYCLVWKLTYQCKKYGDLNILCSTLSSESKLPHTVSHIFAFSSLLEHGMPMLWYAQKTIEV